MKKRFFILILVILFPLVVAAQASGGQIRRSSPKPKTEVRKPSKPHHTTVQTEQSTHGNDISNTSTQASSSQVQREAASKIQPLYISSLPKYNIVVGSWSILANAQDECQTLRDNGYIANIYFESSTMYRVLIFMGTNSEQDAIRYRNRAKEKYPTAWIMCVEKNSTCRYNK